MKISTKAYIKKIISIILILLGISIIIYPTLKEKYINYKQAKLIHDWEKNIQPLKKDIDTSNVEKKQDFNSNNVSKNNVNLESEKKEKIKQEYMKSHMEAMLKIDKISLFLPILNGASKNNLDFSLSSIEDTGKPWLKGNYCIAGHRSRTYGRNFNRLDELLVGDTLEVIDLDNKHYKYIIKEKFIVKAEDVSVLNENDNKKEITLITCHPLYANNPKHRLIIKGEMSD